MKKIQIIDFGIDPTLAVGLTAISLVDRPAIESMFIALGEAQLKTKHTVHVDFSTAKKQDKRRMLFGAVLIPDKLILRKNPTSGEEYYMRINAETVQTLAHSYLRNFLQNSTKVDHSLSVKGCTLVETWLKEFDDDKSVGFGIDEPIGTWFIGMHVENDEVWKAVEAGTFKGFSVEVDLVVTNRSEESVDEQLLHELEAILSE